MEAYREIREAVTRLCGRFPGEYWRARDREMAYPTEFVDALTEAGYLSTLIPEEYGGAGLPLSAAAAVLEEIQRAGCNGAACHAQMYTMGTLLRHGSEAQKAALSAQDCHGRAPAAGFRRHRADQRHRHRPRSRPSPGGRATTIVVNGQKIWTSRAEHSDLMLLLARTTPLEEGDEANRWAVRASSSTCARPPGMA